jgi:hypothetical protein
VQRGQPRPTSCCRFLGRAQKAGHGLADDFTRLPDPSVRAKKGAPIERRCPNCRSTEWLDYQVEFGRTNGKLLCMGCSYDTTYAGLLVERA